MGVSVSCTAAEYEVKEQCCPMCNPGYRVVKHCTEYTSTTCDPCPSSTYTDTHGGLETCMMCTVCESSAGVRVKRKCSSTSDTLCEPLEGHYCTDPIQDGCRGAVEHTKCEPGQFIKHQGTASSDTVCEDCGNNTYSDGTFTSCRQHTQCDWEHVSQKGTSSSDSKCRNGVMIIITIILVAIPVVGTTVVCYIQRKCCQGRGEHGWMRGRFIPMTTEGESQSHPQADGQE
ncbi:hypothetical protein ACEWY4_000265 [Coilia grayii]|uniref:TNFR-Cys domain-containing protein n=1 Tax=Coilia grayii TaxID=363190 RepID=A0ABD1KW67_9TELE